SQSPAPGRDDGWPPHDGPFVLVGCDHGEAAGLAAFPGRAVAVVVKPPTAFAFASAIAGGDAHDLAVRRKDHLERYAGRRCRDEFGTVEECRLNLRRRQLRSCCCSV